MEQSSITEQLEQEERDASTLPTSEKPPLPASMPGDLPTITPGDPGLVVLLAMLAELQKGQFPMRLVNSSLGAAIILPEYLWRDGRLTERNNNE